MVVVAQKNNLKEWWKLTKWKIEFSDNEIIPYSVVDKKQESPVIVLALKCHAALEDKITDTTKKLKDVTNQLQVLKKSQKRLSETLLDSGNKKPKRKACSDCSVQHQRKRKCQIEEDIKTAFSFIENEDFKPLNVELINIDTQETF